MVNDLAAPLIAEMVATETDEKIPAMALDGSNALNVLIKARQVLN